MSSVDLNKAENLWRRRSNVVSEIGEMRGEYGAEVKDFCDGASLNKGAFGSVTRLAGMDNLKAKDWLATFDILRPRLDQLLDQQNDFDFDGEQDEDDIPSEPDGDPFD